MIKYLKPKEFKRLHGDICGCHYLDDKGTHVIAVPYHVSTMTRLHELAHLINNDNGNENITIEQLFDKEVRAELFAYKHMNRELNIEVIGTSITKLIDLCPNYSNYIFNISIKKLKEYNIPFCKEERSNLWQAIQRGCKEIKQKRHKL